MRINKKQDGHSLIAWIVLTPFALIILAVLLCEANKAYWDYKVKGMCEKDGGFKIFEHIEVTPEEFSKLLKYGNGIGFSNKELAIPTDIIFSESRVTIKKSFSLKVRYSEVDIKRFSDGKVVARYISAARIGGDFPSPAHGSSYNCTSAEVLGDEVKKIFKIKESNNDGH